ncbi:MAG: bifunctional phosphoribosylaminoimidazolecarboxamide formyltransferase/inosine monophosphate cyclohydrolase [Rhodospirillaceae bacterium]|nr:bifunctional phosphoribosylaminoimidazolecarboxamide formyltransferase/inosine monophosphate cyclohydrolase [Rhodospirillaceae bacterium]
MTNPKTLKLRRALISVSDKTNLVSFGQDLNDYGVEILSTGGTALTLQNAGIPVTEVASLTDLPEMMGGRVKTLHPKIHGGILARHNNQNDAEDMSRHGIKPIDLVVINLYPFQETVKKGNSRPDCIEKIDIGGPAMIRSAAKNHERVVIVTNVNDYEMVAKEIKENQGATSLKLRKKLARLAFARTASYDVAIANWFSEDLGDTIPSRLLLSANTLIPLRYGENPHQKAAFFPLDHGRTGVGNAKQIQGKELSYNNLNDTDAAFELIGEFDSPAAAIIKHANPCGVALGANAVEAYKNALKCDPTSAFGGIVAFNCPIDKNVASEVVKKFSEVIIAPNATEEAKVVFSTKKNLRLLLTETMPASHEKILNIKSITGGLLVQESDNSQVTASDLKVVTKKRPTDKQLDDLLFAFRVCKHVKSNAIVYAKDGMTIGIGAGQMSRVDSARIAAWKASENSEEENATLIPTANSVAASDAFFPFADGILALVKAGAKAIIQPGGSIRDEEVIQTANDHNLAMVFTGVRNFRH